MNRTRPSVMILSTGNANVDTLIHEANLHMDLAEGWLDIAMTAEKAENSGLAKARREHCIIEQNAAALCLLNARLIFDTTPARPGVPMAVAIQRYRAAGFMGE